MKQTRIHSDPLLSLGLWSIVAVLLIGAVSGYIGESQQTNDVMTETGITVGDGAWIFLRPASWACAVWADAWTDGSVDVETLMTGTTDTPTKVLNVDVASLVGVTADAWGSMGGNGYFRIEVTGSDTINWQCRRYSQ
jgi:Tfp pilus assembly protein PilX